MAALVQVWNRECVNKETGSKTSELLTVGFGSGLKRQPSGLQAANHSGVSSKYSKVVVITPLY